MIDFRDIDTVIETLTGAEMKLWLYLQKLDRFGEKWKGLPTPKELAMRLGLSKRTVEKAMFRLDELGLYVIRIKYWEGVNSSAARAHQTAKKMKAAKKEREAPESLQDERGYLAANAVKLPNDGYLTGNAANLPNQRLNNRDQPPESLPQADSKTPQTIQTYSDLDQTLSDSKAEFSTFLAGLADEREREKFWEFGRKKAAKLPEKPELPDRWVAKYHQELYAQFKATELREFRQAEKTNQQETLDRRKEANEFLAERKNPGIDPNCVAAPQKSAVNPPESTEEGKPSSQQEEALGGAENGKEVFSKAAMDERLAKVRAKAEAIKRQNPSWKNMEYENISKIVAITAANCKSLITTFDDF